MATLGRMGVRVCVGGGGGHRCAPPAPPPSPLGTSPSAPRPSPALSGCSGRAAAAGSVRGAARSPLGTLRPRRLALERRRRRPHVFPQPGGALRAQQGARQVRGAGGAGVSAALWRGDGGATRIAGRRRGQPVLGRGERRRRLPFASAPASPG